VFKKVLIANRGEIALRVIRACRELGVETVAVYSEADRESLHVRFADDDVCIGPAPGARLVPPHPAAHRRRRDHRRRRHPPRLRLPRRERRVRRDLRREPASRSSARRPHQIRTMGDKSAARAAMIANGVPVVPGSPGPVEDVDEALAIAEKMGFPVIIKASAGGGGKGMRVARDIDDFARSSSSRAPRP
jgi:acetyl-CoA carboxylase biotin carboxylase subunit